MKGFFIILIAVLALIAGCIDKTDTLDEKPHIELLLPLPCDTLYFGHSFVFKARVTDNSGLGFISMDLHHNFGHHSHGSHEPCAMDNPKQAVHPYYNDEWIFSLPSGSKEHVLDTLLSLPSIKNDTTFYDEGDYHFHIYITDNEGYSTFTTLDVKVKLSNK